MTPSVDPWLRGLRVFVFVAAVVIVVGTVVLVWLLFNKAPEPKAPPSPAPPIAAEPKPAAEIKPPVEAKPAKPAAFTADLPLPKGVSIIDIRMEGERIVLLLRGLDDRDYLAIVDATTGARLGLLKITAEP